MIEQEPLRDKKHTKDMVVEKLQTITSTLVEFIHDASFIKNVSGQNAIRRRVAERMRTRQEQLPRTSKDALTHYSESVPGGSRIEKPTSRRKLLAGYEKAEKRNSERVEDAERRKQGLPVTMVEKFVYNVRNLGNKK